MRLLGRNHTNAALRRGAVRRLGRFALAMLAALTAVPRLGHAQVPSFQGIGFLPGGDTSRALGVSADGTVVIGEGNTSAGSPQVNAVRWVSGAITSLGSLPGGDGTSSANGVNSDGTVVVGSSNSGSGIQAFRWVNGTMSGLGVLHGGSSSRAYAVSYDGTVVVGSSDSSSGTRAFRWVIGAMSDLGVLAGDGLSEARGLNLDGSVVAGDSCVGPSGPCQAFRWANGAMKSVGFLLGGNTSNGRGVNDAGTVVVGASNLFGGVDQAYRSIVGGMNVLGAPPSSSAALAVSADGAVVVGQITSGNSAKAARWVPTQGITSIEELLTTAGVDFTGWQLVIATGVSANGRVIIGTGVDPAGRTQGWLARLPLPLNSIVAAVAPNARTGVVGGPAMTGFATIINSGSASATGCRIALPTNIPAVLHYQRTSPSNVPIGNPDTPVDLPPNGRQSFVFSISAAVALSQEIPLEFRCTNTAKALTVYGLNTFQVSVSDTAITDMISITDTQSHDGSARIPGSNSIGFIATAAVNIGAAGSVVFAPSATPFGQPPRNVPLNLSICQTNAQGQCINPTTPGANSAVNVAANETVFFTVFIQGTGTVIPLDPAMYRIYIIGMQGTTPVGAAGAAIFTFPP